MAEWSRIVNTTIHEYIKGAEVQVMRNRKLLALLKERGRVTMNHSGDLMDWKLRYKRAPMQGYADSDTLTFSRRDRWKTAQLPWRGYAATDSMTKKEKLMNKDAAAIVKIYTEVATNLMDDMDDQFGDELYIDGEAAGNSKRIHGIESFLSVSGAAPAGFIGVPNDTYAGLSTALGTYGGSWSVNATAQNEWPTGTGDAHYDFFSPLIVDYTNLSFAAAPNNVWAQTCKAALRYGIIKGKKNKSKKGQLDLALLNDELYRLFLNLLDDHERLNVQRGDKQGLYNLGFTDVTNFDGCDVSSEYGIASNNGYGWSMDNVELCSLQGTLFVPEGPDYDIATQSWRFSIDFYGNCKHNPRYFTAWKKIS